MLEDENGFLLLHEPSTCDRRPATVSKGHFTGHLMIGPWPGRVLYVESLMELKWAYCLDAHPTTKSLREQVAYVWNDTDGRRKTHYFDFFVEQADGCVIAYSAKPEARVTPRFLGQIAEIARQAKASGFVDDVRLLTDTDLDTVELSNAQLSHSMRKPDAAADEAVATVLADMAGVVSLGDLTTRTGLGANGYRALIRRLRAGHLRATRHELITHNTEVFKTGAFA